MRYQSVLPPEVARRKVWIGLHANQLYSPAKTIRSLAQRYVECGDDENAKRVFYNKVLGESYDPKITKIDIDTIRRLIVVPHRQHDPEFYLRGQVPPGVRFLTAGQDSRTVEFHFAVWGWGLRRLVDKTVALCGWLIDWGCIRRQYSLNFTDTEYHVFDDLIYRRSFLSSVSDCVYNVMQCGHDIGYAPTQIPIIRYCRNWPTRAIPIKGAAVDATSHSTAPYARWGTSFRFKVGEDAPVEDPNSRPLMLNTFMLKTDLFGWMASDRRIEIPDLVDGQVVGTRQVPRLLLPEDVDEDLLEQSKNEALVKGKRKEELVWVKTGPNHYADCHTYAYGVALNLDPYQRNQTVDEYRALRPMIWRPEPMPPVDDHDPAMG
jgi:phage terminase large subunit GpA-like protein